MPKISQLPSVQVVNDADNFIIEQGGETKRAATTALTDALNAQIAQALTDTRDAVSQAQRAVSQAQGAVSNLPSLILTKTVYVDFINGDDANDGGGVLNPVKSFDVAVNLIPEMGEGNIVLMSDAYTDGLSIKNKIVNLTASAQDNLGYTLFINGSFYINNSGFNVSGGSVNASVHLDLGDSGVFYCNGANIRVGGYYSNNITVNNDVAERVIFSVDYRYRDRANNYISIGRAIVAMSSVVNNLTLFNVKQSGRFFVHYFQVVLPGDTNFLKTNAAETIVGSGLYLYGV